MEHGVQNLEFNLVAFIDILGFSAMVKSDLEAPKGSEKYLDRLYKIHKKTLELSANGININIVQFSDSIVLATPYSPELVEEFIRVISRLQFDLFCEGILTRGGVALGKHFYNDGFMYSLGLIEAYKIESTISRYPRVILSPDLLDLVYPTNEIPASLLIIKENDGYYFIDYLIHSENEVLRTYLASIITQINKLENSSIKEKYIWLAEYINFKFPQLEPTFARFSPNIRTSA